MGRACGTYGKEIKINTDFCSENFKIEEDSENLGVVKG
jgi:hypothetical protein